MFVYKSVAEKYDLIFQFNQKVIDFLEDLLPNTSALILDIGCGTGKYTGHLAERHTVYGIDPDEDSIRLASSRFPAGRFETTDLFAFDNKVRFDLIFSIGNVISHIPKEALREFIMRVESMLKYGGIWAFHTMNWDEILKKDTYDFPVIEKDGLRFERRYEKISEDGVDFITRLTDIREDEVKQIIKLYPQTVSQLMEVHRGFNLMASYGNYAKSQPGPGINSRIFVFKKCSECL